MKSMLSIIVATLLAAPFTSQAQPPWTSQLSGIPIDAQVVLAPVNENVCWAVTRDIGAHYVSRTTNGGTNWIASSHDSLNDFGGVAALSADTAWIAGTGIYKTTNGGMNWTHPLSAGLIVVVHFFDASNGVCLGSTFFGGPLEIYTTVNGGELWTPVPSANFPPAVNGEGFIPANYWAVRNTIWVPTNGNFDFPGSLYKSTDRGLTWSATRNVVTKGGSFVAFKDSLNGLLSGGAAPTVKRTTDGGATWSTTGSVPAGVTPFLMAYVPGSSGSYMITSFTLSTQVPGSAYTLDNGATWTTVDNVLHGKAAFVSPSVGWSWGGANVIYKWTGNPLVRWTVQNSGTTNVLFSVRAVSHSAAWAVGLSGTVLRTTNGGDAWTPASGGAFGSDYISGIAAVNEDIAFATYNPGAGSTTHIYRTTNGGANWNSVFMQNPGFINVIRMIDQNNGVAVGDPNGGKWTVLKTSDGGATWGRISTEPAAIGTEIGSNFNGMSVFGASHIWFTSQAGRVYRSTDGGATWNFSAIPFGNFLPSMHFNGPQYGLVANFSGPSVARTTDGGVTWSEITLPGSAGVRGITGSGIDFWLDKGQEVFHSGDSAKTWSVVYPGGIGSMLTGNSSFVDNTSIRLWIVTDAGGILRYDTTLTPVVPAVRDIGGENLPSSSALMQNYPNPFNPSTDIRFRIADYGSVSLKVFDLLGREVATLIDEKLAPGSYQTTFDARGLSSGVYFYRLQAGSFAQSKKLLLLR